MKKYVIGINSGTSFDGVDVALVEFKKNNLIPRFIDGIIYPLPKNVKKLIGAAIVGSSRDCSLHGISQLNFVLGEIFAAAALKIVKKNKLKSKEVLLIGSHGQTIYHVPKYEKFGKYKIRSTFQIGEASVISQRTGIKTISNFREADISAGGSGAPLMPFLDYIFFKNSKNIKAVLNIGGISNITIVGKNITPIAFDIGPGNALIDLVCKKYFNRDFDKDGKIANSGDVDIKSVNAALKDQYFKIKPPKSTGKEYFNEVFIKKYFSSIKDKKDLLSTLTYFSAACIEKAFYDFIFPKYDVNELIISGGGVKNKTLITDLQYLFPDLAISSSDQYGIPYKYKEAVLFALLAYTSHFGIKNNIPPSTGAKKSVVLGKIIM